MRNIVFSLSVIAGIVCGFLSVRFFPVAPVVFYGIVVVAIVVYCWYPWKLAPSRRIFFIVVTLVFGLWRGSIAFTEDVLVQPTRFSGTGVVVTAPYIQGTTQVFDVRPDRTTPSVEPTLGVVRVATGAYPQYAYGDWVSVTCSTIKEGRCFYPAIHRVGATRGSMLIVLLLNLKHRLVRGFADVLREPEASFASALLLGERTSMPKDFRDALQITGTTHIVAVSGMQVVLLSVLVQMLLQWLAIGAHTRRALAALFLLFFTAMIGAPASAVRGLVFGLILLFAQSAGRPRNMSLALATACATLLLAYPPFLFDAGFLLSFLAVIGIVYGVPVITHFVDPLLPQIPWVRKITAMVIVTLAATVITAPLIAYVFGRISFVGIIVNLFVVPFVEVATIGALLVVLLALIHPLVAFPFGVILSLVLTLIMKIIYFFALFPGGSATVSPASPLYLLLMYTALFGALFYSWLKLSPWERTQSIGDISSTR
ncbi:ComEC/Rec2 family competence protein [Candidatus Uhrbacteria bacterium]|nr:ComEC/Rec2 family competence protein [Candidatus Uhrbacteria bacterium]